MARFDRSRRPKSASDLARRPAQKSSLRRFLIVCEGEKTEPLYLQSLVRDLRLPTANVEICGAECSSDPGSVVSYAIDRCDRDGDYDVVLCVIDQDTHKNLDSALDRIKRHKPKNGAIFRAILSVPCFEFWLLLHFECRSAPFVRSRDKSPGELAVKRLQKEYMSGYAKGKIDVYSILKSRTGEAIKNSAIIIKSSQQEEYSNPSTQMHELVCTLHHEVDPSADTRFVIPRNESDDQKNE